MGLGIVDRRFGGEVISGGRAVWLAEEPGEGTGGGDVVGEVEDMTVVIIRAGTTTVMSHDLLQVRGTTPMGTGIRGSPRPVCWQPFRVGSRPEEAKPPAGFRRWAAASCGEIGAKAGCENKDEPPCATDSEMVPGDGVGVAGNNSWPFPASICHAVR